MHSNPESFNLRYCRHFDEFENYCHNRNYSMLAGFTALVGQISQQVSATSMVFVIAKGEWSRS